MNWEQEYLKKADYARSLEQRLEQAERRLAAWECVRQSKELIRFDPVGHRSNTAVREARVQDMQYATSICDEQVALMANSMEFVCMKGIDELVAQFKKTITFDCQRNERERVTTATLTAIMERK